MANVTLPVEGMTCEGCIASVQKALSSQAGVKNAQASLAQNNVQIEYDPAAIETAALKSAIEDAGFDVPSQGLAQ